MKSHCVNRLTISQFCGSICVMMNDPTTPDPTILPPCPCGRPRDQVHRKLCWSCTNFKKRYGLTRTEMHDQRLTHGKLCRVCDRLCRKNPIHFNGHRVCSKCVKVLHLLNDQRTRAWFDLVLKQTGSES